MTAVEVDGLGKRFRLYSEKNQSLKATLLRGGRSKYEEFWALRDVSFEVPEGSTFGLIGENGSGKSTLLKCLARILEPDEGSVRANGKVAALLELGSGFHPELSGRENVFLNGSILGLSKKELASRFDEIVDFSGIEHFIDQPVKNYSSGMYVRLGFAVAINVDPDILLVDEVLAVGDASFQRKCEERFADFRASGRTVVLVSHAMSSMRALCDNIAWLDHGTVQGVGPSAAIVNKYVDESQEERVVDEGGESRWGSGGAAIERVELLDVDGSVVTSCRTGDRVVLRLQYQASEAIRHPVFGYAIETLDGTFLWAHDTRDAGVDPEEISGAGCIELVVPNLPLQPGVFDVSASILGPDGIHVHDHRKAVLRFDVLSGTPSESGGLVVLGGRWSHPVSTMSSYVPERGPGGLGP